MCSLCLCVTASWFTVREKENLSADQNKGSWMYCLVNTKLKICIFNQLKNNTNLEIATLKKSSPHSNETFQNIQYIDLGCLSNFLKYYFSWEQYWVMLYPASQCYSYVCTIYISLPRTHKCNLAFITQLHCNALLRVKLNFFQMAPKCRFPICTVLHFWEISAEGNNWIR